MDQTITIGARYLREGIKRDYNDWRFAWAREVAQNSLDAGSSRIDITVSKREDGDDAIVTWSDNGKGMDEETIRTKFMAIGETGKEDSDVGGFGVAGALIAFAQVSYSIRTRDCLVNGQGSSYGIKTGLPYHRGVKLTVVMDGASESAMESYIRQWCRFSTTNCEIYLNGERLTTLRMHRPKAETEWCKIYTFREIPGQGHAIRVRMNKQYMFRIYSSIEAHIVVDLYGKSLEYLTSNRDGLNWAWQSRLQKLVEELYADPKKIQQANDHVSVWRGTEGLVRFAKPERKLAKISLNNAKAKDDLKEALAALAKSGGKLEDFGVKQAEAQVKPIYNARSFEEIRTLIDGHDVVILNQTTKPIPSKYLPGKMNKVAYKLLNRWIRVVQACGEILGRNEAVAIGWVFSHDKRAAYKYDSEHGHMILLNPVRVTESRFEAYWDQSVAKFYELVACAVHEICHIDNNAHNTPFARDLTYGVAKVMAKDSVLRKIRSATR